MAAMLRAATSPSTSPALVPRSRPGSSASGAAVLTQADVSRQPADRSASASAAMAASSVSSLWR